MVAIHGLPGSARDFRWLAPHVAGFARLVRLDLPGFGETPAATEPDPSPEGRARAVVAACRALDLRAPVLLGHSMGAVVACAAAVEMGDEAAAVVLLSSPGLRPHPMLRRVPFRAVSWALRRPRLARSLRPALRALFERGGFRGHDDAALARTMHAVARTSIEAHGRRARALRHPTMLAWCDDDPIIPPGIVAELAAVCPPGPRLRFSRGAHNPQKACAAELAAALEAFLDTLPPT